MNALMDDVAYYKFKWDNYDLERYVESRKAAATLLRRKATDLTLRAEQIEEELAPNYSAALWRLKDDRPTFPFQRSACAKFPQHLRNETNGA